VLEQLGLVEAGDRLARTYSGGMRRRLDLGASLVGAPSLLLLDEPTTGLDPRSRIELWNAIRALVLSGTDVLLTTQYLDEADHLASQIVIIDHGHAVAAGTPAQLKQRIGANLIEVHVRDNRDVPIIAELFDRLGEGVAQLDEATRRVSVRVDSTGDGLMTAMQSLHATGVELDDIAMRQPNLDDVFLTLTGQPTDNDEATAARAAGMDYVDYLVPGFLATGVLFSGIGTAAAMAEDLEQGFIDRLRSLPIPRAAVLTARATADIALVAWSTAFTTAVAFGVGFQLHGSAIDGLAAFGLVIVFGFAFEWLVVAIGLFAGSAQAAQGMGMIVFPFAFVSSAYVRVSSMPSWLQVFANHQPLTYMVDSVRALTLGPHAHALLGHPSSYFVTRAMMWALAIIAVTVPLAVAKYRRG
jgi:ABC-2 type transport system permease protein